MWFSVAAVGLATAGRGPGHLNRVMVVLFPTRLECSFKAASSSARARLNSRPPATRHGCIVLGFYLQGGAGGAYQQPGQTSVGCSPRRLVLRIAKPFQTMFSGPAILQLPQETSLQ